MYCGDFLVFGSVSASRQRPKLGGRLLSAPTGNISYAMNTTFFSDSPREHETARFWIRWLTYSLLVLGILLGLVALGIAVLQGGAPASGSGEQRSVATENPVEPLGAETGLESKREEEQSQAVSTPDSQAADEPTGESSETGLAKVGESGPSLRELKAASRPLEPASLEDLGETESAEKHLSELPAVPEEVVSDCEKFFPSQLDEGMRIRTMEGPAKCDFSVEFEGYVNSWTLITVPKLPKDLLSLIVVNPSGDQKFELQTEDGTILEKGGSSWTWEAPEDPGIYCVRVVEKVNGDSMCFHVAVMEPWNGSTMLGDYRIGHYQDKPFRDNPRYQKPRGFIKITSDLAETWLSPHFQVKQFLCKQDGDFPKYFLVEPRLLIKLETLIERLEAKGIDANRLYILSGFRTPWYNEAIGNTTYYSRHLYGDAADLFVDVNEDGRMDDLDLDGSITGDDARVIYRAIQKITAENTDLVGGLGFYDNVHYRNPFIHVDTRGYPARWSK